MRMYIFAKSNVTYRYSTMPLNENYSYITHNYLVSYSSIFMHEDNSIYA